MDTEIQEIALAKRELTNDGKIQFDSSYATRRKDPSTALLLSLFVWSWIDWFRIRKITREKNLIAVREIHDILIQMRPEQK